MRKVDRRALFGFIGVCLLAGLAGYLLITPDIPGWYAGLHKPAFTPPDWAFSPVWTVLYIAMGIAAYMIWKSDSQKREKANAILLFAIQLVLNVMWVFVFFGMHNIRGGFLVAFGLMVAIALTIVSFAKISGKAALLLVPYILWVIFATALNFSVVLLNP